MKKIVVLLISIFVTIFSSCINSDSAAEKKYDEQLIAQTFVVPYIEQENEKATDALSDYLNNIYSLDLNRYPDIKDSDIMLMTQLTEFRIGKRQWTDLSTLSNLNCLEVLDISDSVITDISDLANLKSIESLYIDMDDMHIDILLQLPELKELFICNYSEDNCYQLNELKQLKSMETLHLEGLPNLAPVASLNRLSALYIQNIRGLSGAQAMPQLKELYIDYLDGPAEYVEYLQNLKILQIGEGDLNNDDLKKIAMLTNLEELKLQDSWIEDISSLSYLKNLKSLDLNSSFRSNYSMNCIKDISPLSELTGLTYLDLSGNYISDFGMLAGLINIEYLDIGGNFCKDYSFLSGMNKLKDVRLSFNNFERNILSGNVSGHNGYIDTIPAINSLENLELEYMNIYDISELPTLENLKYLNIEFNNISDVSSLERFKKLEALFLCADLAAGFKTESLSGLTGLKELYVSGELPGGDISWITTFVNLEKLGLRYTGIGNVEFVNDLRGLKELEIIGFDTLNLSALDGNQTLELVEFYSNKDMFYHAEVLGNMPALCSISVNYTALEDTLIKKLQSKGFLYDVIDKRYVKVE